MALLVESEAKKAGVAGCRIAPVSAAEWMAEVMGYRVLRLGRDDRLVSAFLRPQHNRSHSSIDLTTSSEPATPLRDRFDCHPVAGPLVIAAIAWLIPVLLVYLGGLIVQWVYRGFKATD